MIIPTTFRDADDLAAWRRRARQRIEFLRLRRLPEDAGEIDRLNEWLADTAPVQWVHTITDNTGTHRLTHAWRVF